MLSYAFVALGGALGSVARYWVGLVAQSILGAAFPWGTLIINVIGSLVIGFFATLTASDGRLAATPDLRVFVIVGLCGGFTTFSSFSLQTLELIRDGRPLPALANVLLSAVLCILSVALGYWAALGLRGAPVGVQLGAASQHMVVALTHEVPDKTGVLAYAARLAPLDRGRITLIAIESGRRDAQPTEQARAEYLRQPWIAHARPVLEAWIVARRADGVDARLITVRDSGALNLLEHGRSAHLLLLDAASNARQVHLARRANRPVLLVPRDASPPEVTLGGRDGPALADALGLPVHTTVPELTDTPTLLLPA